MEITCKKLLVMALGSVALVACDSLSDPRTTEPPTPSEPDKADIASVRGALSGSVPEGTKVALVWKLANDSFVGGDEAPVENGRFRIVLSAPPDGAMSAAQAPVDAPPTSFDVGYAGFVLYRDSNGNGHLDVGGVFASSADEIIGGANDLALTYFRGGSALDYEKLRDRSGVLPHAGYNMRWRNERWFESQDVVLETNAAIRLPYPVCVRGPDDVDPLFTGPFLWTHSARSCVQRCNAAPTRAAIRCSFRATSSLWAHVPSRATRSVAPSGLTAPSRRRASLRQERARRPAGPVSRR